MAPIANHLFVQFFNTKIFVAGGKLTKLGLSRFNHYK